jgi:hypothetical protein
MTKFRIEIDSDSGQDELLQSRSARSALVTLSKICVVSVMPFKNTAFEQKLKVGLGPITGANYQVADNIGYDLSALQNAVNQAAANSLVVTVGGLAAAMAADNTTVPYIALTGADFTASSSSSFAGGISLSTATLHSDQLRHLHFKHGKNPAKTCLLYNGANPNFSNREKALFSFPQSVNIDQTTSAGAVDGLFNAAFAAIDAMTNPDGSAANIEAIIVSADAFFTTYKDSLITQAGNRYLVYPFNDYKTQGKVQPAAGSSTIHGPRWSLVEIYLKLGLKAKAVLKSSSNTGWDKEPLGDAADQ